MGTEQEGGLRGRGALVCEVTEVGCLHGAFRR